MISIQPLLPQDISEIVIAFDSVDWPKPQSLFEAYLQRREREAGEIWIARIDGAIAGYVTLQKHSLYPPFASRGISEIMDLNVLPQFRSQGVATQLMDRAELEAFRSAPIIGLGVGLYGGPNGGYGAAQRLYMKRGYIPDGKGVTYGYAIAVPGESYRLDDDLILWMTKSF